MTNFKINVIKYYLINNYYIVGNNSTKQYGIYGITDESYSSEIIINETINEKEAKEFFSTILEIVLNLKRITIHSKLRSINN